MRSLSVIAVVLCLAACGGSKRADPSTTSVASPATIALLLHGGQTKVIAVNSQPRKLHVRCASHGTTVDVTAPVAATANSGIAVGRDYTSSGPTGSAILSFSMNGTKLIANCG